MSSTGTSPDRMASCLVLFGACWLACSAASVARADQRTPPANPPSQASGYGGGGIRGAAVELPDGWLVTQDEAKALHRDEPPPLTMRSPVTIPGPTLTARVMPTGQPLRNPITVQVVFQASEGVPMDLTSIEILYGSALLDVTARAKPLIQPNRQGFELQRLRLPPGGHKLLLRARDTQGHQAQGTVLLEVE